MHIDLIVFTNRFNHLANAKIELVKAAKPRTPPIEPPIAAPNMLEP